MPRFFKRSEPLSIAAALLLAACRRSWLLCACYCLIAAADHPILPSRAVCMPHQYRSDPLTCLERPLRQRCGDPVWRRMWGSDLCPGITQKPVACLSHANWVELELSSSVVVANRSRAKFCMKSCRRHCEDQLVHSLERSYCRLARC